MSQIRYLPSVEKYFKKLKDKKLKLLFRNAVIKIREDYTIGQLKSGDLAGIYCYDIFYNRTNYELAYKVEIIDEEIIVIIMAGTRENFYEALKRYIK